MRSYEAVVWSKVGRAEGAPLKMQPNQSLEPTELESPYERNFLKKHE